MAISIKNHEDRITALENVKDNYIRLHAFNIKDFTGSVYEFNNFFMFELMSSKAINNNELMYEIPYPSSLRIPVPPQIEYISGAITVTGNGNTNCQNVYIYSDRIILSAGETNGGGIWPTIYIQGIVPRLKLYYNFSYNITREFYKVKFNKLRHYLCSHLQNYASNKGGVIQNGY